MTPYEEDKFQHTGFCMDVYELKTCKGCPVLEECTKLMEKERRDREWLFMNLNANIAG